MKRLLIILVVVVALVLSGCEEMFTFNAFDGMGAPDYPETADAITDIIAETTDAGSLIDTITELTASPTFFANLDKLDPAVKEEILEKITDELRLVYTNENTDEVSAEERAEAAILTAEIYLNSNEEAQEVVNSVVELGLNALDDPEAIGSVEDAVVGVLESAFGGVENLESALDALSGAADAYTFYGYTLPADTDLDLSAVPVQRRAAAMNFGSGGPNTGAIAQNALVAIAVDIFRTVYITYYGTPISTVEDIIYVVTNLEALIDSDDPDGPTNNDLVNEVMDLLMENEAFMRILAAANFDALLGGFDE